MLSVWRPVHWSYLPSRSFKRYKKKPEKESKSFHIGVSRSTWKLQYRTPASDAKVKPPWAQFIVRTRLWIKLEGGETAPPQQDEVILPRMAETRLQQFRRPSAWQDQVVLHASKRPISDDSPPPSPSQFSLYFSLFRLLSRRLSNPFALSGAHPLQGRNIKGNQR